MRVLILLSILALSACGPKSTEGPAATGTVIYAAQTIVTMEPGVPNAEAVAVLDGKIVALGSQSELTAAIPGAELDLTFEDKVLVPGLIDPHVHMSLSSIMYATAMTPPWPLATPDGMIEGFADRAAFLAQLVELEAAAPAGEPLVIYGFHDLVHGDLDRHDLDQITTERPLIIWHYSGHDFYLNTAALEWAGVDASLHTQFEGVPLGDDGEPTGRVFEDAVPVLLQKIGPVIMTPERLTQGLEGFSSLLRSGGVTTVADLGYGLFGLPFADYNIASNWRSIEHAGYRLYLVPEHRAFQAAFGDERVETILDMVSGERTVPAPVLPQVKFFTDAAFYSQTMRVSAPGYLAGQSVGSQGLWVMQPDEIAPTMQPYWDAGLGIRVHSNGDAAQTATLAALAELRESGPERRFVIEHAGVFLPDQITLAADLGAVISAASHYVFYLGEIYQAPLGPGRGEWISPLASLSEAGVAVTLHSDAPLAPPMPLLAASVHMTRATREGNVLTPTEKMSAHDALQAITIDAAYALGLEAELGSIAPGKLADFTVLDANPLDTVGEDWPSIKVWGVVVGGQKRAVED